MRICFALLYHPPDLVWGDPSTYLDRVRTAHELPRAVATRGHEVHVIHAAPAEGELLRDGVRHHFVAPGRAARLVGGAAHPVTGLPRPLVTPAWRAVARLRHLRPDVVHALGTGLRLNLALLAGGLGRHPPPIVLHHHGGEPAARRAARALQRFAFRHAARVLFTTPEQAARHRDAGLFGKTPDRAGLLVEGSSPFRERPRADARRHTGMHGAPVCLSAARLQPIKDPWTVLRGFARISAAWPDARLYLHYLSDELLPELRAWVDADPARRARIEFRGPRRHAEMEAVFNSADFFLQASRREHSGYALLDAMACGVVPVVSDIPSFRVMTDGGAVGVLFPPGDDGALARRVLAIDRAAIPARRAAVRAHFARALSFEALATRLDAEYERLTTPGRR